MQRITGKLLGGGLRIIPVQDIAAIQSHLQIQRVYLRSGESFDVRGSLLSIRQTLEQRTPGQFITTGKGVLVNVLAITAVHPDHVDVEGSHAFPVAKRSYRRVQDKILGYLKC